MLSQRPLIFLAVAVSLAFACDQESPSDEPAGNVAVAGVATKDAPAESLAKPAGTPAQAAPKTSGLKCVKSAGTIKKTVHMGVVQREGKPVTAIRTDTDSPGQTPSQAKSLPTSFEFDDGQTHLTFLWQGPGTNTGPKGKSSESAYPPKDIEMTLQMAKRTRGECEPWEVDAKFLLLPEHKQ
jgi:hypothetical protein